MSVRNACSASAAPVLSRSSGRVESLRILPSRMQDQAVAPGGLVHDVARHEHGSPTGGQAPEELPEVASQHRVEAHGRLVEDEDLGITDERAGKADAGLLPAGEVLHALVDGIGEVDLADDAVDGLSDAPSTVAKYWMLSRTVRSP